MLKKIILTVCASCVSSMAMAQPDDNWRWSPEFSVGGGYGFTKIKDGDFDEDEAAKKAFALVKFNEYIGIEASYIDFDDASNEIFNFDVKGKALNLILELPITQGIGVYAKGGQLWWDADTRVRAQDVLFSRDYDGNESFWGLGAKFRLAQHWDLRVEYERFNFEISRDELNVLQTRDINMDLDYASVSVQFTF